MAQAKVDMAEIQKKMLAEIQQEFDQFPARCGLEDVEETVEMVPMSDGVKLKTYIFRQKGIACAPALLVRTCYPGNQAGDFLKARNFAAHGFFSVIQYCRGTEGSEGEWEPNFHERSDGTDTINWLADQPWVESIGYYGASYLALTGWAMIDSLPDKVKGMYLSVYGTNRYVSAFNDGLFRQDVLTSWAMDNAGVPVTADYIQSCCYKPQVRVDEDLWGVKLPWYEQMICSPDGTDDYWNTGFWSVLREMPSRVKIPIVFEEGWYDHHLGSALSGYRTMSGEGLEKCLLRIGPWNHGKYSVANAHACKNGGSNQITDIYNFFTTLLKEGKELESGVSLYVIGEDRWINEKQWPKVRDTKHLYLNMADKSLCRDKQAKDSQRSFVYDPENPVPSYGTESCLKSWTANGSLKQPEPDYREDVISFVSQPVTEDIAIMGKINVDLYVSSDAQDTAFSVKIMEVLENGEAYNIRSGITTLAYRGHSSERQTYTPGEIVKVNVDTWDIAWTIKKGSRIRVDISSSDFPQYSVHTNYPGVWALQEKTKKAVQTIYSGKEYPSAVNLPVV